MSALTPWIAAAAIGAAAIVLISFLMVVLKAGRPLSQNISRLLFITVTVVYAAVAISAQRWTNLTLPLGLAIVGAYGLAEAARGAIARWSFWALGLALSAAALALQLIDERLDFWLGLIIGASGLLLTVYAGYVARRLIRNSRQTSTPTETGTPA